MELNSLLFPSPKTKISLEVLLNARMAYIPKLKKIAEDSQIPMSPRHLRPSDMMARYPSQCVKATKNIAFEQTSSTNTTPVSSRRSSAACTASSQHQQSLSSFSILPPSPSPVKEKKLPLSHVLQEEEHQQQQQQEQIPNKTKKEFIQKNTQNVPTLIEFDDQSSYTIGGTFSPVPRKENSNSSSTSSSLKLQQRHSKLPSMLDNCSGSVSGEGNASLNNIQEFQPIMHHSTTSQSTLTVLSTLENSDVSMQVSPKIMCRVCRGKSSKLSCASCCNLNREVDTTLLRQTNKGNEVESKKKFTNEQSQSSSASSFLSTIFGFARPSKVIDAQKTNSSSTTTTTNKNTISSGGNRSSQLSSSKTELINVSSQTNNNNTNNNIKGEKQSPAHRVSLSCDQSQQQLNPGMILTSPTTPDNPLESIRTSTNLFKRDRSANCNYSCGNLMNHKNNQLGSSADINMADIAVTRKNSSAAAESQSSISSSNSLVSRMSKPTNQTGSGSVGSEKPMKRFTETQMNDATFMGYDVNVMYPVGFVPVLMLESHTQSANLLIYFHGNGDDVYSSYPLLNHFRTSLEVNVIAVEYPGYGQYKSPQGCTADTIEEDAEFVLEFVTERLGFSMSNIVLVGRSLGTGPATYLASKHRIGALALISAFTSIRGVVSEFAGIFKYIVKERFDNLGNIKKVHSPTFLLHGKSDRLISYKQSLILKDHCKGICEVRLPNEMNHREFDYTNDLSIPMKAFLIKSKFPLDEKFQDKINVPEGLSYHPSFSQSAWTPKR